MMRRTSITTTLTDSEVIGRVRGGERQQFESLISRYQDRIYGLAYHYTRNFEDAHDVAQEAFIRAYCQITSLRNPERFGAWLKQITVNECRMRLRNRATHREDSLSDHETVLLSPENLSGDVTRRLAMQTALNALPEANRLALTLFYFHSYSLDELAIFLEVPASTVMSRLRNAKRQLKKEWLKVTQEVIESNRLPQDWAKQVPIPYDEYDPTGLPAVLETPLSAFREQLILSAFPAGSKIVSAGFEGSEGGGVFVPVRVEVKTPDGVVKPVRLQMQSKIGGVEREARLLPVLTKLVMPVPELLAGPVADPDFPEHGLTSVNGILPGENMLNYCWDKSPEQLENVMDALFVAIERMHSLTPAIECEVTTELEHNTLSAELAGIVERGGPWMKEAEFAGAVEQLIPLAAAVTTPIVFSNGIYAPNAFHTDDGSTVTGYNNFTFACFEDPHIGFAKYLVYDWFPLNRAGIIERWCARHNLSKADFALRLAIRCLTILQREVSVRGKDSIDYRQAILNYLRDAMKEVTL